MTAELVPRRSRKRKSTPEDLAIGEINQTVFTCPACTRPLVLGAKRCPGCGTHLIIGVQARRAGVLMGIGVFAGVLLGGVLSTTATVLGGAIQGTVSAVITATSATPTPVATASPDASGAPATPGTNSSLPALTRSALVQSAAVNQRLAASSLILASALKAKNLDAYGVSQTLRSMSADAVVGLQMSLHVGAWADGKELSGEMASFYASIQKTAATGLSASLRNDKAYRASGQHMMVVLGGLAAFDMLVRQVAGEAGVTFPAGSPAP